MQKMMVSTRKFKIVLKIDRLKESSETELEDLSNQDKFLAYQVQVQVQVQTAKGGSRVFQVLFGFALAFTCETS